MHWLDIRYLNYELGQNRDIQFHTFKLLASNHGDSDINCNLSGFVGRNMWPELSRFELSGPGKFVQAFSSCP